MFSLGIRKIYQTKSIEKRDKIKPTKLNLENQIYQAKCLKCNEPIIPNQIDSIKPTKLNPTNQFYQTKSRKMKKVAN